jgi:integrase
MSKKKRKKRERRAGGDGSIYKIAEGKYRGSVTVGYDAKTGKQRRKYIRGKSEEEVRAKLRKLLPDSSNRLVNSPERVTVEAWVKRYVEYRASEVRPNTRRGHQLYLGKILQGIGHLYLHDLKAYHVRDFYAQLAKAKLSPATRQHVHDLLKGALRDAERMLDGYQSPMSAIDRPKGGRVRDPEVWSPEEVLRFLRAVRHNRLYGVFYFMLTQGLRIGEVLGLRWSDLQGDKLSVERTIVYDDGKVSVGPPKTKRGYRALYLKDDSLAVLRERREVQEKERELAKSWGSSTYIFSSTAGTLVSRENVRRVYKNTLVKLFFMDFLWNVVCFRLKLWHLFKPTLGIRYIRLHDHRHTYITTARDKGIDLEVLAHRVGQDPMVTASIYSHIVESRQKSAARSGEELYSDGRKKTSDT